MFFLPYLYFELKFYDNKTVKYWRLRDFFSFEFECKKIEKNKEENLFASLAFNKGESRKTSGFELFFFDKINE